jgi:hypothetical protein
MTERTDTIAEFYQCNCAFACDCEVDAREHMADSIAALRREIVHARALVKAAYLEGADRRNYVGSVDTDDELWRWSAARKALEVV